MPALGQIQVGAGASIDLGSGTLDAGCRDVNIAGAFNVSGGALIGARSLVIQSGGQLVGGSGSFRWSGDWTNSGQFLAASSTASSVDGCGATLSTFTGPGSFYAFQLQSSQGREIRFTSAQTTAVAHAFVAQGISGTPLRIRATTAGNAATMSLAAGATQNVFAVDVADNHASPQPIGSAPASASQSIKGSNSDGWFESIVPQIPTLSVTGLALLAAILALTALVRRSHNT